MAILKLPYNGRVKLESPYGNRILNGVAGWHAGIDLVGLDEKIIRAPCDGVIGVSTMIPQATDKTLTWQWGNYVRLDGANGLKIYMCHMERRLVSAGQTVKTGDELGIEGNTGYSFGSHCHFEVRPSGSSSGIDPTPYLGIQNALGIYENPKEAAITAAGTPGDGNVPHEWAKKYVEWAIRKGILRGDSSGKPNYRLNDGATREEILVFMGRLAEVFDDTYG